LFSLELRDANQPQTPANRWLVEALRDDFLRRLALLHVQLQNPIEQSVRREAVLIRLVGPQLGRRRLAENRFWNVGRRRFAIAKPGTTIIFGRSAITARPPFMSPYSVQ